MEKKNNLMLKVSSGNYTVGIIGLGYVGLPLAVAFANKGINVIGFEKSAKKINAIKKGKNYITDINNEEFVNASIKTKKLCATSNFSEIKKCDIIIICVPTPLDSFKNPDLKYIEEACVAIGKNMHTDMLISLESTTYPTTTENFMKPILERESGLKEGTDFFICFSPERVDPGNIFFKTANTPKVIGALGKNAEILAKKVYGLIVEKLHTVSSPRCAEMVKILENTYRLVNISLINEIALLARKMQIDIFEVIEAAKTKPYGFQAFYPGPGVGGHCIPLDPFYLEYIAKNYNVPMSMIHSAGLINDSMPKHVLNRVIEALNSQKKCLKGAKLLFLGVSYKPNINDVRESPALLIMKAAAEKDAKVSYHDPYIPEIYLEKEIIKSMPLSTNLLRKVDCVIITTNHRCFDINSIIKNAPLIVDTRNSVKGEGKKIFKI